MFPQIKVDLVESESGLDKRENSSNLINERAGKENKAEKEVESKARAQSKKGSKKRDRGSAGRKKVNDGSSPGTDLHRPSVPPSNTSETFSTDDIWSERSLGTVGSSNNLESERNRRKSSKHVRISGKNADQLSSGVFKKRKNTEKLYVGAVTNIENAGNVDICDVDLEKNSDGLNNKPENSEGRRNDVSNILEKNDDRRLGSPVRSEKSPNRLTVTDQRNVLTSEVSGVKLGISALSAGNATGTDLLTVKPAINEGRSAFDKSINRRSSENPKCKNVVEFQKDDPHLSELRASSFDSTDVNTKNLSRFSTFQRNFPVFDSGRENRDKTRTNTPNYINIPVDNKERSSSKTYCGVSANVGESSSHAGNCPVYGESGICAGGNISGIDAGRNYAGHGGNGLCANTGRSEAGKTSPNVGGGSCAPASGRNTAASVVDGTGTGDISASTPTLDQLGVPHSPGTTSRKSNKGVVSDSIGVPLNKMSLKLYGSKKAVQEEQARLEKAGTWIIHPYSNFRLIWDTLTLLLLLVNITLIPVAIAYWKLDQPGWLPFKVNKKMQKQ